MKNWLFILIILVGLVIAVVIGYNKFSVKNSTAEGNGSVPPNTALDCRCKDPENPESFIPCLCPKNKG